MNGWVVGTDVGHVVHGLASANEEGGHVDEAATNTDVALEDGAAGVVNAESETQLVGDGLEAAVKELGDGEGEDVIELELVILEETELLAATEDGSTLEHTAGVVLGEGEEETGSGTELTKSALDTPDLTLAAKAILTAELELLHETFLLERTARNRVNLGEVAVLTH